MVYFTSAMSHEEVIQLIRKVDISVFCLWQRQDANTLWGAVKDSAYELFIVACSLNMVRQMKYLTLKEVSETMKNNERMFICGNQQLIEHYA